MDQKQVQTIYMKVMKLASVSEQFRKELLENANVAFEKVAGEPLPQGINFRVIECDPAYTATFVLPPLVPQEMTEDDLEAVAGGRVIEYDVNSVDLDGIEDFSGLYNLDPNAACCCCTACCCCWG
ncbi:MAG: hypothetical protein FWC66_10245 [Oscillospiraceae bacterium]|nr:hypothetical protein [Oscillospiraceae bacterium]